MLCFCCVFHLIRSQTSQQPTAGWKLCVLQESQSAVTSEHVCHQPRHHRPADVYHPDAHLLHHQHAQEVDLWRERYWLTHDDKPQLLVSNDLWRSTLSYIIQDCCWALFWTSPSLSGTVTVNSSSLHCLLFTVRAGNSVKMLILPNIQIYFDFLWCPAQT